MACRLKFVFLTTISNEKYHFNPVKANWDIFLWSLKIIAISIQGADDKRMFNTNFYITHLNTHLPNIFLHIAAYHHNLEPIKHFKIR